MKGREASLFSKRVWQLAMSIPSGRVTTYGAIARKAGGGGQAARSISAILSKSPEVEKIPWHRIVYSDGRVWLTPKYEKERMARYKKEGIEVDEKGKIKNFHQVLYEFR